jgi:hypothetical protein
MEVSGQLHAPTALPSGEYPPVATDTRLGGPQRRSGYCGEDKNLLPSAGDRTPAIQLVARRYTELCRLPGCL